MSEIYASPLFGIVLCIFSFEIGLWINRKTRSPLANPLLIAIAICIAVLQGFAIPLESFQQGGTCPFDLQSVGGAQKEFSADSGRNTDRLPDLDCQRTGFVQIIWFER